METITKITKILLVEDHELTRIGLRVALEKYDNIKIIGETGSGKEAVDLANSLKPNVILMDIGLHELDGIEATRKIKEQNPNIKVIMVSSHEGEQEIFASFASGADGYAVKESKPEQIHTAIETVSHGDAWLSNQIAEKILRNFCGTRPFNSSATKDLQKPGFVSIPLSERELEVLKLIVDGKSNQEIADTLYVSLATAKSHVRSILTKLCVDDRTQAAVKAMREGIV